MMYNLKFKLYNFGCHNNKSKIKSEKTGLSNDETIQRTTHSKASCILFFVCQTCDRLVLLIMRGVFVSLSGSGCVCVFACGLSTIASMCL